MKISFRIISRIAFVILTIILLYFSFGTLNKKKEKMTGLWLTKNLSKDWIFSYTYKIVNSKTTSKSKYFLRLIDIKTGKIEHQSIFLLSTYYKLKPLFYTQSSLWIQKKNNFIDLKIPSLKEKYSQKEFYKLLKKDQNKIAKIYSVKWKNPFFIVENNQGETFKISPLKFENKTSTESIITFNSHSQMGDKINYSIPLKFFPDTTSITYAKNYAVFTPDSTCLLLEGNKRLVMKKLISEKPKLKWLTLMDNKVWLKGELLRPYKKYKQLPTSRLVITKGKMIFLFYHTSLNEKEDIGHLTAINYKKENKVWDIDLSELENISEYRPTQNYIYDNLLITLWETEYSYLLTGIDIDKGKIIWKIS